LIQGLRDQPGMGGPERDPEEYAGARDDQGNHETAISVTPDGPVASRCGQGELWVGIGRAWLGPAVAVGDPRSFRVFRHLDSSPSLSILHGARVTPLNRSENPPGKRAVGGRLDAL
jgi:hypothetical protein